MSLFVHAQGIKTEGTGQNKGRYCEKELSFQIETESTKLGHPNSVLSMVLGR